MRTRAAVLYSMPGEWQVEELELDPPGDGEVLVEMVAAGLCHSDDHLPRGSAPKTVHLPCVGGHEGGGIIREVGPNVKGLEVGDHVLTAFVPACGKCRWCASGKQNLCDNGALIMVGHQLDGTFRMHTDDGRDVGTPGLLGTFSEWQVYDQQSCVKIGKDIPLEVACLVSCGVQTGFGSAGAGDVQPGDVVVVAGVGGVGMSAVQGARLRGAAHIIVADPVDDKQKWSLDFGATEAYNSIESAEPRIRELTNGQGADVVILTAGLVDNELMGRGYQAVRKAGTLVVTGVSSPGEDGSVPGLNAYNLAMFQKRIQGALYGMKSPREAMPMLLDLYRSKKLMLDELVTKTYSLDEISVAYEDMRAGRNIRGVIRFKS